MPTVVLGVSGSIAAYKAADLASQLVKAGVDVHPVLTASAANFVQPITFRALTSIQARQMCLTSVTQAKSPIFI